MAIRIKSKPSAPYWAFVEPGVRTRILALLAERGDPADQPSALFTGHLLQASRDRELLKNQQQYVATPHELIQECRGLPTVGNAKRKEDSSGPWLEEYCARVGTDFVEHEVPGKKTPGKHRRVNAAFLEGIRVRPSADARDTYVHVWTGLPRSSYAVEERIPFSNSLQREIARYIDSLPRELYYPEQELFARALDLSAGVADDNELLACALSPPRYEASGGGNTERIQAAGWSQIPKGMRRALRPGDVELDLVSAHAAAYVKMAVDHRIKMPILSSLLDAGDAWLGACELVDLGAEYRDAVKELCIKAMFGRSQEHLRDDCAEAGLSTKIPHKPLFNEIISARKQLGELARQQGFLKGPGGRKNHLKKDEPALLHSVCSDYELQLIYPVYEVAKRHQDAGCYVALHQHDGVAVAGPTDALELFIAECQTAVAGSAAALGVRTRLAVKHR